MVHREPGEHMASQEARDSNQPKTHVLNCRRKLEYPEKSLRNSGEIPEPQGEFANSTHRGQ